jgi:hypothetical protein
MNGFVTGSSAFDCYLETKPSNDAFTLPNFNVTIDLTSSGKRTHRRPTDGVLDHAGDVDAGVDLPKLLEPDGVRLRVALLPQLEPFEQLLGQVPVAALGKDGALGVELHASFKVFLMKQDVFLFLKNSLLINS